MHLLYCMSHIVCRIFVNLLIINTLTQHLIHTVAYGHEIIIKLMGELQAILYLPTMIAMKQGQTVHKLQIATFWDIYIYYIYNKFFGLQTNENFT